VRLKPDMKSRAMRKKVSWDTIYALSNSIHYIKIAAETDEWTSQIQHHASTIPEHHRQPNLFLKRPLKLWNVL
jgi:hypothetical protein